MQTCSVCRHEQRAEIDEALVRGTPLRPIAAQYHVSTSALVRHRRRHLGTLLQQAVAADQGTARDLLADALGKLDRIEREAVRLSKRAEQKGDYRTALAGAVDAATRLVELTSRLRGLLAGTQPVVQQVFVVDHTSPQFETAVLEMVGGLCRLLPADQRALIEQTLLERWKQRLAEKLAAAEVRIKPKFPPAVYSLPEGDVILPRDSDDA